MTAASPPAEQLSLLGILRDPPPGANVDPAKLGPVFLSGLKGIRTNYIRLLPAAPGFPHQLLYTAGSGDFGAARFSPAVGAYVPTEAKNLICVEDVNAGGVGGDCTPTSVLTSGHWLESAGLNGYGLVPDGVAGVILRYPDRPAQTEPVTETHSRGGATRRRPDPSRTAGVSRARAHTGVSLQHHVAERQRRGSLNPQQERRGLLS